jgi:hypothetical protein
MYLAKYSIQGAPWVQASADLVFPHDAQGENRARWQARFRALVRAFDTVPQQAASLRVHLGTRLESALFVIAPETQTDALRRSVGRLTQLDVLAESEVRYPCEQREHDRLLSFPRFRCRAALPQMTRGDAWFAFDFRIRPFLNELLTEAHALEHALSYHVNVEPIAVEPEWERQAARNALRVQALTAVPIQLDQLQHDLAVKLRRATHVCEELLGVETPAARVWLQETLERRFRERFGKYVKAEFTFEDNGFEESLDVTRHRAFFEPLRIDEMCSATVEDDERIDLLTWTPPPELADLLLSDGFESETSSGPLDYTGMPQSYDGSDSFAFISYKRDDLGAIKGIVAELAERGHRIWYDKGILAGSEWDAMIEERIQLCKSVILFVSARAVKSKFVRREVKFADSLNKPIVAIQLEPNVELADGMAMLLNQYHYLDAKSPSMADDLQRALRSQTTRSS